MATLGITEVQVFTKPKIAIVVTGNELIEASTPLTYGKIYESNGIMLLSALNNNGYDHVSIYKVTDNYKKTVDKLNKVIAQNDMVIISGGISVGDYDFVGKALNELNVEQIFYKVNQKPGKPLFFGTKKNTKIFALPGNPASALSCFYVYVYPALQSLSGNSDLFLTKISANSTSDFIKKGDRSQFLKAFLKNCKVTILEGQSSAMLKTFSIANALVYIPEHLMNISKGDLVEVILLPV